MMTKVKSQRNMVKLGVLADITSSKRIYQSDYVSEGVPFYRSKEIIEQSKGGDISTELFIDKDKYLEIEKKFGAPQAGDILITSVGTLGVPYLVKESDHFYFKDGNLIWFRDFSAKLASSKYVYYWLKLPSTQKLLHSYSIGSSQSAFTIDAIKNVEISLPEVQVQNKVTSIISAYDAKIENNNKIIKTLEEIAQAIFKEWFVHYRFPGYEKAEFVDSEMGRIPKGWKILPLNKISEFLNGLAMQKYRPENDEQGLPVIKIREMNSGVDSNSERATSNLEEKYKVEAGDILFSWSGSLELMRWSGVTGALNQHIFKVTQMSYPSWFVYYWIHEHLQYFRLIASSKATSMGHIQRHHIAEVYALVPTDNVMSEAHGLIGPMYEEVHGLRMENHVLGETRDLLLPRLMKGELVI